MAGFNPSSTPPCGATRRASELAAAAAAAVPEAADESVVDIVRRSGSVVDLSVWLSVCSLDGWMAGEVDGSYITHIIGRYRASVRHRRTKIKVGSIAWCVVATRDVHMASSMAFCPLAQARGGGWPVRGARAAPLFTARRQPLAWRAGRGMLWVVRVVLVVGLGV